MVPSRCCLSCGVKCFQQMTNVLHFVWIQAAQYRQVEKPSVLGFDKDASEPPEFWPGFSHEPKLFPFFGWIVMYLQLP